MKSKFYLIAFIFIGSLCLSCESDDISYQNSFENSLEVFETFKIETNNSYTYTVQNSSWAGWSTETKITVVNGVVTQRHFKYFIPADLDVNLSDEELEWIENGAEIGSHSSGAHALILDAIYDKAENEWLVKRKDAETYFETDNNGLISVCGYTPDNCMDDCFSGIRIISVEGI